MIKAVVFDWAGTMVDHGSVAPARIMQRVFENHNVSPSMETIRRYMGIAKHEHIDKVLNSEPIYIQWMYENGRYASQDDVMMLYQELEACLEVQITEYSKPIAGVLELIDYLREDGVKIGSTTGYSENIMDRLVPAARKHGLKLDSVICASDVPVGRPYPWMCYMNAIRLNTYPLSSMVKIGDTVSDVLEGLNAGMWTVAVVKSGNEMGLTLDELNSMPEDDVQKRVLSAREKLSNAGAHYLVDSINQIRDVIVDIDSRMKYGDLPNHLVAKPSMV